ncbi:hypothetical protein E2C01_098691 [Portunus trituberculatus]|uniref:Uncharacterized protein n=1 Tax=Portunus trituberculatus TaxID=210409 RepID=A0A5B7K3J6_PORTR|nr:hypothetical protein [Portunus trituberculatus]
MQNQQPVSLHLAPAIFFLSSCLVCLPLYHVTRKPVPHASVISSSTSLDRHDIEGNTTSSTSPTSTSHT